MTEGDNEKRIDILISQYEQCWYDIRDHSSRFWQIPLAIFVTDFALLGIAFQFASYLTDITRLLLALTVAVASLGFWLQINREVFFETSREYELDKIQKVLVKEGGEELLHSSFDIEQARREGVPRGRLYRGMAVNWLRYVLAMVVVLVIATILLA